MSSLCQESDVSLWEVDIFYLEIFPNKMSVYVRLRCINQSTIRARNFQFGKKFPLRVFWDDFKQLE